MEKWGVVLRFALIELALTPVEVNRNVKYCLLLANI